MWELAQLFNGLFGLTYPQGRKRHHLCLQSKCSTFLSPALLPEKGCLHSYCRCGKELILENAEGDLLKWKGLKNKNERMSQRPCPALKATCSKFPLPITRAPKVSLWVHQLPKLIQYNWNENGKQEVAHFNNHFKKGQAIKPFTSEASFPLV